MMLDALAGRTTPRPVSSPHWWGLYKFQHAGVLNNYDREAEAWKIGGQALYEIDRAFYEDFQPDQFHLSTGPSRLERSSAWKAEEQALLCEMRKLESAAAIDRYFDHVFTPAQQVVDSGCYEHVRLLAQEYGDDVLILLNEGNPVCGLFDPNGLIGFEEGLIALIEHPEHIEHILFRAYALQLERVKALQLLGAHGYIGSETYCSPDLMSPGSIRALILPAISGFYHAVARMGMIGVAYYLGDVEPLIDDLCGLGVHALMVEEGKKTFKNDIGRIYRKIDGRVGLYGNVDGMYDVRFGNRTRVIEALERQIEQTGNGFISACGSPLCFDTPEENVRAFAELSGALPTN